MRLSASGRSAWRVFAIQILIVCACVVIYLVYSPYHKRELAARAAAAREQEINAFFREAVAVDHTREISVPMAGAIVKRHPQKLVNSFSAQDAESALGLPDAVTTDFAGGQHLTWRGTTHKLEASFSGGRIYCLGLEDLATGHGALVYLSPEAWHPY